MRKSRTSIPYHYIIHKETNECPMLTFTSSMRNTFISIPTFHGLFSQQMLFAPNEGVDKSGFQLICSYPSESIARPHENTINS